MTNATDKEIKKCLKKLRKEHGGMSIKQIDNITKAMISYCEKHKSCMFAYDGLDITGRHINARIHFGPEVSQ
jgi:hypothetical protein